MIIATREYELSKILKGASDEEFLKSYVRSLVPEELRHIDAIYHNTCYYLNMEVLASDKIPIETKQKISGVLTKGLRVVGYLDKFITYKELKKFVNMEQVNKYYEGDNLWTQ